MRYVAGAIVVVAVLAGGLFWLRRQATRSVFPPSPETGGREAFRAFLKAIDSGVSAATAVKGASPAPAIVPAAARPAECATQ
jgi:hypothetical protein